MEDHRNDMNAYAKIVEQYKEIQPNYEFFSKALEDILRGALKTLGISASVQSRAKGIPNFAEKIIRKKALNLDPINYFTDLCGARVIVDHQDDIAPVSDFIKKHFEIDIENSLDAVDRLGAGEFGYRSVHYIVSLKPGTFDEVLKHNAGGNNELAKALYRRRSSEECTLGNLSPGPKYKAEIQVRTLLQHAWAVFSHDRVYKGNFDVPHWLQRDINRIAALLENADSEFSRAIRGAELYETQYGVYLDTNTRTQKQNEIKAILEFDPGNTHLIHRLAQLSASLGEWDECINTLKPLVEEWEKNPDAKKIRAIIKSKDTPDVDIEPFRNEEMAALLTDYGRSLWKIKKKGRDYIDAAILLDSRNIAARLALAETHKDDDPELAYKIYAEIYSIAHDEPQALEGMIGCKIRIDKNLDFIVPLLHNLKAGIETCKKRADVGVYIPQAYYQIGLFSLLLDKTYESLTAYTKAVINCDSLPQIDDAFKSFKQIKTALNDRLTDQKKDHFTWVYRYLMAAVYAKAFKVNKEAPSKDLAKLMKELKAELAALIKPFDIKINDPAVIVSGGCLIDIEEDIQHYRPALETAFEGFSGTLFCGGTQSGISGMVGDLACPADQSFQRISFLPELIPTELAIHQNYIRFHTDGKGFSPMESIHVWLVLLYSGLDPVDVRLLGINGGPISAFEYRLGLSMGANVGIIKDSGRAASAIFDDPEWKDTVGLLSLPSDPQTIKCFIQGSPTSKVLDPSFVESMAKETHEQYRADKKKTMIASDPALAEWSELKEHLKESNRDQIKHIETKLNAVGLTIEKIGKGESTSVTLTDQQIETLAEIEHGRWNMERIKDGWKLGERDVVKKFSPYLIPWISLPEDIKKWDREPVREIPNRLKKYGYQLVPLKPKH